MVEINTKYEGALHCHNTHEPTGSHFSTDAPLDNNGRGETFSPTDLLATAQGSCMATIMGIVAQKLGVNLEGMQIKVEKHMSDDLPRRVARLNVRIDVPLPADHPERGALEHAALSCPVSLSLHPEIEVPIDWRWRAPASS
ncbi:MAG: OsmC family protein [Verrucomicrobiae bacterium]|nr:OsmC family protein [Verrucomicrobiae bacterium]NNJ42369.1 OsmC family protein [Akkermansiaceae bacterium]